MLKVIKFIITGIVGLHIMGGLAMFVREWWLFRKSKVRARKIAEPHNTWKRCDEGSRNFADRGELEEGCLGDKDG